MEAEGKGDGDVARPDPEGGHGGGLLAGIGGGEVGS